MATTTQAQLLDAYAAVDVHNFQLAVGRQSLSWAPGLNSMMWSDNSEPVTMVRLVNPEPFLLPGFLRHLGPVRVDQFFGRLEGHPYVPNPFVYGQKINVKLFPFLELGFGRRTMIGGKGSGNPLTTGNLIRSFVGVVSPQLKIPVCSSLLRRTLEDRKRSDRKGEDNGNLKTGVARERGRGGQ